MISLESYIQHVYQYASSVTCAHLSHSVFIPLGLVEDVSDLTSYTSIFATAPGVTSIRSTGLSITSDAYQWSERLVSPNGYKSLQTLRPYGLPHCVCISPVVTGRSEWQPEPTTELSKSESPPVLMVDVGCAEAVLRGSDVYSPGIITTSRVFGVGQRVRIGVWIERRAPGGREDGDSFRHKYPRNSMLPPALAESLLNGFTREEVTSEGSRAFVVCVGEGTATMDWKTISRHEVPGTAVRTTWTPFGQPSQVAIHALLQVDQPLFLQNYSSMVPVSLLVNWLKRYSGQTKLNRINQNLHVLDACGAPGGKTSLLLSQLWENMPNTSVVCCERSVPRFHRLVSLIHDHFRSSDGVAYVEKLFRPLNQDTNKLVSRSDRFEGILLDPPCTGLGLRPKLLPYQHTPAQILSSADYQRKLFDSCVQLLQPRGVLVYSTCTITFEENEANVLAFLRKYPQLRLARAQSAQECELCRMQSTNYTNGQRFLLQEDIEAVQATKEAAPSQRPLLVLRFSPRAACKHTVEDGVGFFVAVFEVFQGGGAVPACLA